jgi:phosphatidylglycerophosphatase A
MKTKTESIGKPRLALLIATGFGLGYLPIAPGTWGSLGGVAIYWAAYRGLGARTVDLYFRDFYFVVAGFHLILLLTIFVAALGVWAAGRIERFAGQDDPQFVVVDEVSGQLFTYVFGGAPGNWKYLLLGFILFRVFDIWKPFPARQAESLPGSWGIMVDDWCAAVYAAALLWLARGLGL